MSIGITDIRYVCLSDMHLGAESSLLTNVPTHIDPLTASPVLIELMNCLKYLISRNQDQTRKPTLILLGDILELALANDNDAAMVFERFLELALPAGSELFEKIVYIPGNHDHHLWESARETQYVLNYLTQTEPGTQLYIPLHITKIFMELAKEVSSFFLTALAHRYDHLKDFHINSAYPNFGLVRDNRAIIFHHGHFVESTYQLMTTLKNLMFPEQKDKTRRVDDLEAENFAWIDFFWSTMGRSGEFGKDVEIIYDQMQNEEQFRKRIDNLAIGLAKKYGIDIGLEKWLNTGLPKLILDGLVDKLLNPERSQGDKPLSSDAEQGLLDYVNGPLQMQITEECQKRQLNFPQEVTFIFGHTHKPFEKPIIFQNLGNGVPVYNTGGWVVETQDPAPLHGGAVVLLNDNLDVASLRLYNEAGDSADYHVEIHEVPPPGHANSDFFGRLQGLVQPDQLPWSLFSQTVPGEVSSRRENLKAKINDN